MITSEFEYHLISALIVMKDRQLAQKIELLIWYRSSIPQPNILKSFIDALKDSSDEDDFDVKAAKIVSDSGCEFVSIGDMEARTKGYVPPGYINYSNEEMQGFLLKAEMQECTGVTGPFGWNNT